MSRLNRIIKFTLFFIALALIFALNCLAAEPSDKIMDEISTELDYFKNLEAKEHADKFRELKKERNEFISELHKGGKSSREIAHELKRRYGENWGFWRNNSNTRI